MKRRETMFPRIVWALAGILTAGLVAAAPPSAEELLDRSVRHHDPEGHWGRSALELTFAETRPDGTVRRTVVELDAPGQHFALATERKGHPIRGVVEGDRCNASVDGRSELTPEELEEYGLGCERLRRTRDYYDYLWGLPMKLRDPGTVLGEVEAAEFDGSEVWGLRVTYSEEVGSDIWYVYFDRESAAMTGYRFYHDEAANDGEYILLAGETEGAGLRLPKTRRWYTHGDEKFLGTDDLVEIRRFDR